MPSHASTVVHGKISAALTTNTWFACMLSISSIFTGKIALAHRNEFPDYTTRPAKMEREAKAEQGQNQNEHETK